MRTILIATGVLAGALAADAQAAQQTAKEPWLAWAGCWRVEGDSSDRALCTVPDGNAVRMITLKGGSIESEGRLTADGNAHAFEENGCSGSQTARWSEDGKRVFLRARLDCGDNVREVSGLYTMLGPDRWVNVQAIGAGGDKLLRPVYYVAFEPGGLPADIAQMFENNRLARETARLSAAGPLNLADVKEAAQHADAQVVEAWITTVGQEFRLNGQKLVELADAGVPPSVIDVLVAVSNPKKFAVTPDTELVDDEAFGRPSRARNASARCLDSFWIDPYDPFAYRHARYYQRLDFAGNRCGSGWAYGLYPTYSPYYRGYNLIVVLQHELLRPRGRVSRNGYVAPRDPATGRVVDTSWPKTPSAGSGSGNSSGDGGTSDGGGGRKAKPRNN